MTRAWHAGISTVVLGASVAGAADINDRILASTNQGELVRIDLIAGTATLIGDAGSFDGKDVGWADIAVDPAIRGSINGLAAHPTGRRCRR